MDVVLPPCSLLGAPGAVRGSASQEQAHCVLQVWAFLCCCEVQGADKLGGVAGHWRMQGSGGEVVEQDASPWVSWGWF